MKGRQIDWKEVRKILPEKPILWKCKHICEFLKVHALTHLIKAFGIFSCNVHKLQ